MRAHLCPEPFKEEIIQIFYDGIKRKPETTFGNIKASVIADKEPNFCEGVSKFRNGVSQMSG